MQYVQICYVHMLMLRIRIGFHQGSTINDIFCVILKPLHSFKMVKDDFFTSIIDYDYDYDAQRNAHSLFQFQTYV